MVFPLLCGSQTLLAARNELTIRHSASFFFGKERRRRKKKSSACRGEGSAVGLQLRVRFVPAALLAMLRTALALQCVSEARDWTGHVDR
jgi:hypothetical protein